MAKSVISSLLVIGDNHEEIAKKYSLDTKVEPYVKYRREDAAKMQKQHLKFIDSLLTTDKVKFTVNQRQAYKELYQEIKDMDDFDYYIYISSGCTYDMDTMDALSTENPNAAYRHEMCYQERFKSTGVEANLTTPFTLKDGSKSYVAKKGEIDWDIMHMRKENIAMYECAWDLVVNHPEIDLDLEKLSKEEAEATIADIDRHWIAKCADKYGLEVDFVANIWNNMKFRDDYFGCFTDMDEYVRHSCSFWTYGVATEEKYYTVSHKVSDKEWVRSFYSDFIEKLPDDTTLSIYEIRLLDD